LKKELDALGCDLLKEVLAALEQKIYHSEDRKRCWKVERRNDKKVILTSFGQLEYNKDLLQTQKDKRVRLLDRRESWYYAPYESLFHHKG